VLAVVAAVSMLPAAAGAAAPDAGNEEVAVLPVFTFRASNGYSVIGIGGVDRASKAERLLLLVLRRGSTVSYEAPAVVTEEGRIEADLGNVGSIDLHFVPSGAEVDVDSPCGGETFRIRAGRFEGTIILRGEEGYTNAQLSEARPYPRFIVALLCAAVTPGAGSGASFPGEGALLSARRKAGGTTTLFRASAKRDAGRSHFSAEITEKRGAIRIQRSVEATGSADGLDFPLRGQRAGARPPRPFSGTVAYRGAARRANRWLGTLAVDFPGHSDVHLAGRAFKARLRHASFRGPLANTSTAAPTCPARLAAPWISSFRLPVPCSS
jgi:hypothetical protein